MSVLQPKAAKVTAARALDIVCEECETLCVDTYSSTMITEESETVLCECCGTFYEVPSQAFRVVYKAKCKAKGKHH